jgi:hypothetical protein
MLPEPGKIPRHFCKRPEAITICGAPAGDDAKTDEPADDDFDRHPDAANSKAIVMLNHATPCLIVLPVFQQRGFTSEIHSV